MRTESRLAQISGTAAVATLLVTVCALPWIHGGTIPAARLVLQTGACLAGLLSLLSTSLQPSQRPGFPPAAFALGTLAAIGIVQLLPVHAPLLSQMNHAVLAEMRHGLPSADHDSLTIRTASPADTRVIVAQLLALMLLAVTACEQIRDRRTIHVCLSAFTANGLLCSVLAFAQQFQGELFLIRDEWWTGMGGPFGPFVNSNSAAGWLTLGFASAIGLVMLQLQDSVNYGGRQISYGAGPVQQVLQYLAGLTATHVATWVSLAMIAAAMFATRSRGAMVAIAVSFVLTVLLRLRYRQIVGTVVVGTAGVAMVVGLLWLLGLQESTASELRTLYDPVGAVSERMTHWRDSLQAAQDFPVFGAGLGAYRYVTLPYQTHDAAVWFQHADNQYVEFLVEAGVIGLIAFVLIGLPVMFNCLRLIRRSALGGASRTTESVAMVLAFATAAQALFSLFDYGVMLPATSALFIVLVSMLRAIQDETDRSRVRPVSPAAAISIRVALLVGAAIFTTDLVAAQRCYVAAVAGRRVRDAAVTADSLEERAGVLRQVQDTLRNRPDDPEAHETIARIKGDLLRAEFTVGVRGLDEDQNLATAWPQTSSVAIARRIDGLQDHQQMQQHVHSVLRVRLGRSEIIDDCRQAVRILPLVSPILRRAAKWETVAAAETELSQLAELAGFVDPARSSLSLQLGEMVLRRGNNLQAIVLFNRAIEAKPALRREVLGLYAATGRLSTGLESFGPTGYVMAVESMSGQTDSDLLTALAGLAAGFWEEPAPAAVPGTDVQLARGQYLGWLRDRPAQIEWLQRCVRWSPNHFQLHTMLANALAQQARYAESIVVWQDAIRIDPSSQLAKRQLGGVRAAARRQQAVPEN